MAFIYCLNVAADFSDRIGESMGATYRSTAEDIKAGRGTSEGGRVAHAVHGAGRGDAPLERGLLVRVHQLTGRRRHHPRHHHLRQGVLHPGLGGGRRHAQVTVRI